MERLKLINSTIQKILNINYLIDFGFIGQYFVPNDHYELFG